MCYGIPLWFWFVFSSWIVILSIFSCSFWPFYLLFGETSIQFLCHFLIRLLFLWWVVYILYVFWILTSFHIWFSTIFSWYVGYLILLMVSLATRVVFLFCFVLFFAVVLPIFLSTLISNAMLINLTTPCQRVQFPFHSIHLSFFPSSIFPFLFNPSLSLSLWERETKRLSFPFNPSLSLSERKRQKGSHFPPS